MPERDWSVDLQPMANNYFLYIILAIGGLAISCSVLGYI